MEQQGTPLQRWQKPLDRLTSQTQPITFLRISNGIEPLLSPSSEWVSKGNVVVLVGVGAPVTAAPFQADVATPAGSVRLETSRRANKASSVLADRYGAIVWQEKVGLGQVIHIVTPFLAANAYQDFPGNFAYLAKLVTEPGKPIWVDEYLHGYKDAEQIQQETEGNVLTYLANTPLLLLGIQAAVLLAVLLWGQNQRLGRAIALPNPPTDNSTAYIEALAAVLRKAEASEFVVETVAHAEQLALQQKLGLGNDLLPLVVVSEQWAQQTGRSASELENLLRPPQRRFSEAELQRWVEGVRGVME